MRPRLKMSLAGPAGWPLACSGLMYCGVPRTVPVAVRSSGDGLGDGASSSGSLTRTVTVEWFGQAPVHDQGLAVRAQHDVRRLQVAVYDPLVVGIGHRVADRDELLEQAAELQAPLAGIAAEGSSR